MLRRGLALNPCTGIVALAAIAVPAATASATIRTVYPTASSADLANIQAAVDASAPGDTIVLKARDIDGNPAVFDFSGMASGGGVTADKARLRITGEMTGKNPRVVTTLVGPTSFAYPETYVAFMVDADDVRFNTIKFDSFEAAIGIAQDRKTTVVQQCGTVDCAYGVFGYGNNDHTIVRNCKMKIAGTPFGGNAAVTIQEGAEDCHLFDNAFVGPGAELTSLAVIGVFDYNTTTGGDRNTVTDNSMRKFDVGAFLSSRRCQISRNQIRRCADGIAVVSEVAGGLVQGTQLVTLAVVNDNTSIDNTDDGINLVGVQDSAIMRNILTGNGDFGLDCDESSLGTTSTGNTMSDNVGSNNCTSLPLSAPGAASRTRARAAVPTLP